MFFWAVEGLIPLIRFKRSWRRHAGLNLFFTLTTIIVNFLLAALIIRTADYCTQHHFGLLYIVQLPIWLFIPGGLLILDLISAWLIHWLHHQIRWLWQFHLIHHSDTWVDTTTANRHHPGESLFRAIFTLLAVAVAGAPAWMVLLYQSLSVLFSQFNHANISLPKWLDNTLAWVIVSPDMHKVHHHYRRPLTDSNYGNIFSCWDRLFGTFNFVKDTGSLHFGIDTHPAEEENNNIRALLNMPFQPYRPPTNAAAGNTGPAVAPTDDTLTAATPADGADI